MLLKKLKKACNFLRLCSNWFLREKQFPIIDVSMSPGVWMNTIMLSQRARAERDEVRLHLFDFLSRNSYQL